VLHHLKELVEHQGVNPRQIALLGFSQGGVVALHAGLVAPWKLGAIVGLSTWLPAKEGLCVSPSYLDLPIWLGHGIHDDVVPYSAAERAKKMLLSQMMTQVTLTHWSMGHSIHHEEIIALKDWLLSLDAPTGKHNHHAGGHHTGGHH
jgi:phospholipase/carboxylesterase